MRKHIDYRLSAAALALTLFGGSICRAQEPTTEGWLSLITLCGHICDGQRCYETEDAAVAPTVAAELAAGAQEDLNFRIETRAVAPPMPMLRTKQTAVATTDPAAPARCELGSPTEAAVSQAAPSYGPEILEVVRLRSELEAAQHQLRTQCEHHAEVLALLEQLHEAKTQVAQVAARQESRELFCKQWGGLVEQHFKAVAERSVMQSKHDDAQQLHETELEATRLKAELAAAKEWISQRVAAEQTAVPPFVSYPYPHQYPQPFIVPPNMIPAPLAIYEPQFVAAEGQPAPTYRPSLATPVPFALGTYVPGESINTCPACPAGSCSNTAYSDTAYSNTAYSNTAYSNTAYSNTACSNTACSDATCGDATCGGCNETASPAVCDATTKVGVTLTAAADASAACVCTDCNGEECVCTGCVCSDQGVCGCIVACPTSDSPTSETADANVASRGDGTESAASR